MAKSRKFSVRLLKREKTFEDARKDLSNLNLISQDEVFSVYLASTNSNPPWWKNFLEIEDSLFNQSNSAILTIKVEERIFVYTFGFAHNQLKQECFEENFGFLVTINSIDGEKLKSIDAYSPSSNTKQKRVVSSILSNIYEYDFDNSQDLVQKLSGVIKDEYKEFFSNPTGADSLSIHSKATKEELKDTSKKLLERFESDDYKSDPYLKNINKIKRANNEQIKLLNDTLISKLNDKKFADIYMADLEILEQSDFYSYKFKNKEFSNLSIDNFDLEDNLTLDKLNSLKISVLKSGDDPHPIQWSLYKCLVFDLKNIFLSKGSVYVVEQDFLTEVEEFNGNYMIENFLPTAKPDEKEGAYNQRICDQIDLFLLDKKCPNIEGHSKVEICDIYRKSKKSFIHVKKSESSSSLSHLWNQGVISEQLANSKNQKYLDKFKEEVRSDLPETREIYYGIIKKQKCLPIFSKISLYNAIKTLKGMGKNDSEIKYFYIDIKDE